MNFNHLWDWQKNVREITAEFVHISDKSRKLLNLIKKLLSCQQPRLKSRKNWRASKKMMKVGNYFRAARRDFTRGNRIIEIHQNFAEIENDDITHDISLRPSSARLNVNSSANSNPLPAGKP